MTVSSPPDFNPAPYVSVAAMVDAAPLLIASIGPDLRFRLVNAEYERRWQRPRDWFVGRTVAETLPAAVYRLIRTQLVTALAGTAVDFEYAGHHTPAEATVRRDMRARYTPNIVNGQQDGIVAVVEDITRYRAIERAMQTTQQQLADIVDHVPVFIAYFGADWRYQFVNAAYEQWYGKPRHWFVGRTVREVMGEESFARIEAQMHRVMGGEAVHFVFERRAPNGDYTRVLDTHFVPDIGANGVQGIYALVTDHTERRLAEDAALRARWEMRAVADNLPSLITYIDADMRYRYVNAGFLAWYQQPPDAFIGHQVADVVGPSFTLTGPLMQRALQGESLDFDYARRNDYFADPERILRVRLLPDTVAGITRGFIALIDDITDARQANAALRRAEQELRAVIDTIPELVAAFDMQARFIYVNRSFAAWYGAPEQWFPGLHLEDVLAPALTSTVMPAIRRVMTGARVSVQPEGALIRPCDGAQRFYRTNYAPFMDGDVQRGFVATAQDITEWVEANRALRQQEIRLRQIADASSDAFWLLTLDNATPFYVSPGFEAIFGRRCAEAHGNAVGWLEAIHSEDRERMANAFSAMLNGAHLDAEYRILRPDGEVRWVHDKARLVRDGRGMPLAIAGVVSDVSERRLQHSELVEYARRLEHAQTVGTLGFLQVELTGQSVLWSAQLRDIFDLPPSRAPGTFDEFLARVHADDRVHVQECIATALDTGQSYDFDHRIVRSDGEVRHIHEQGSVERDAQGHARRLVGIGQDITARKGVELQLKENELRLLQITEHVNQVFWLMEAPSGKPIYVSPAYASTWDLPLASAYSEHHLWLTRIHAEDDANVRAAFKRCLVSGHGDIEFRIAKASGELRWMRARAFPIDNEHGQLYRIAGFIEDITDGKRIAELQRLKDEAESANRTKSEFLSKMSHELRTPLNAILGFSQLMHYDQGHPLGPEQRESVDEILTAGHHLLDIVDEMLDLTRIEIGKLKVTLEPVDLRDICAECLAMVQSEARQRHIEVSFTNGSRHLTWALADRTRARQIVLNLLGNAVKYNLPHGAVDVSIDARAAHGYLRILVADNGPGLSAEQIGKLFVPFQRLDAERISVAGLGLGLALSKQLAEAMGGRLAARGTLGEGCTFWLDLPVASKA